MLSKKMEKIREQNFFKVRSRFSDRVSHEIDFTAHGVTKTPRHSGS